MDELTRYIIHYYYGLMTVEEKAAYKNIIGEQKVRHAEHLGVKNHLRKWWISEDSQVQNLLADGPDVFFTRVRDRILRDHADEVFLNHCPRCGALAKTPTAKQCPKCFFSWHDEESHDVA